MFWKTLPKAFALFSNPWIALACLSLVLINFIFFIILRRGTQSKESNEGGGPGCLFQIVGLLFQGVTLALFVLLLLPILLGSSTRLSWQEVEPMGFIAARSGILAVLILSVLSFIPYLGRFLAGTPGLEAFLMATLTFRFLSPSYLEAMTGIKSKLTNLFPDFWASLGYLTLALLLSRLIMLATFTISRGWGRSNFKPNSGQDFLTGTIGPSLDILGGIVAFFMYAQYVQLNTLTHIP